MQTYSHILIAAAIRIPLKHVVQSSKIKLPEVHTRAFIFGSFLPDLALILITLVCVIRDTLADVFNSQHWLSHNHYSSASPELLNISWTASLFDDWFFNNPIIITLQNTFHSPVVLILLITFSYWYWNKVQSNKTLKNISNVCCWVFFAALLHTLADIPLHTDDGPLIFFPIDWNYRFSSPISYWDPSHHGHSWSLFEHALDGVLILFLVCYWWKQKQQPSQH